MTIIMNCTDFNQFQVLLGSIENTSLNKKDFYQI